MSDIEQRVEIHMVDGKIWATTLEVSHVMSLLEEFNLDEYDALHIGVEDPERQWHIRKASIVGIEVFNLEDVNEASRSVQPPAKSRRRAG